MKNSFLLALFTLSALSPAAFASFELKPISTQVLEKVLEPKEKCSPPVLTTRPCYFESVLHSTTFDIAAPYKNSPLNQVILETDFKHIGEHLQIRIAGVAYNLNDEVTQSFPVPAGAVGTILVEIIAPDSGVRTVELPFRSLLKSIRLSLDGTAYANAQLASLQSLAATLQDKKDLYLYQKRFLRWFQNSLPRIRELKESLTGRDGTDMSYDCEKPERLMPDECQYLKTFNDFLSGVDTGINEDNKDAALLALQNAVTSFESALDVLKAASISYDETYVSVLEEALRLIVAESNAPLDNN